MQTTIDKAGRVVIPKEIRTRAGLDPGTLLEVSVEGFSVRLARAVPRPRLERVGSRLIARPTVSDDDRTEVDVAGLVESERGRWPL